MQLINYSLLFPDFALSYYNKLKETLSSEDYQRVMEILIAADESKTDAVDIYNKVVDILIPSYCELAEEFLLFLNEIQANAVGKVLPYHMVKNMTLFLQKVDLYFQDKPFHVKRIYKTLTDLGKKDSVTLDDIKKAILPLIKGNEYLMDLFLQNFVNEHPPDRFVFIRFASYFMML